MEYLLTLVYLGVIDFEAVLNFLHMVQIERLKGENAAHEAAIRTGLLRASK